MFPQDMFGQMSKQMNDMQNQGFPPQKGFEQPPQGFPQQPPQGFQQPPQGFPQPQQGFPQQQQQGFPQTQQGFQQQQGPQQGFNQPNNGFGQPPQGYGQPWQYQQYNYQQQQNQYAQHDNNQQQFQKQDQQQEQGYPTNSDFKHVNFTHSFVNGQGLKNGEYMKSSFDKFFLVLHDSGNMVLYKGNVFSPQNSYWSTNTSGYGNAPYQCILQKNGNLELKDASGGVIWETRTTDVDRPNMHRVELKSDGNLLLKGFEQDNIWCSGVPRK